MMRISLWFQGQFSQNIRRVQDFLHSKFRELEKNYFQGFQDQTKNKWGFQNHFVSF